MLLSNLHSPSTVFLPLATKSDQTMCSSPRHQSCYDNCDDETNPHLSSLPFALYHCHSDLQIPYGSGGWK